MLLFFKHRIILYNNKGNFTGFLARHICLEPGKALALRQVNEENRILRPASYPLQKTQYNVACQCTSQ